MGKRNSSLVEDLFEATAKLPWWFGAIAALLSYIILHQFVASGTTAVSEPSAFHKVIKHYLLNVGQYVLPLIFGFGAVASLFQRRNRNRLFSAAKAAPQAAFGNMSWQEFEVAIGEAFRRKGFSVEEKGGPSADGGVDLVLRKEGERYPVQCKHWRANKVGVATVRELYGVMAAERASGGFVVTSGEFTDEARKFAAGREVELINGKGLVRLFRSRLHDEKAAPVPQTGSPSCPKCGSEMVQRKAKRGTMAGSIFWGCSRFPGCRGIRPG